MHIRIYTVTFFCKFLLYFCSLFAGTIAYAQTIIGYDFLDTNNIRARFNAPGDLFWDWNNGATYFEIPKGSGRGTVYISDLWIGGKDAGGQLHMAANFYRNGTDFYQGPVMNTPSYSSIQDSIWNRVWKINKSTVDSFRWGFFSSIPPEILNWPGNGDTTAGQAKTLAPFYDADNDGLYNPYAGDFPCIRGDQAVFFIFNDDRDVHTETKALRMGIEVRGMAYEINDPSNEAINNTLFLHYSIINRSAAVYNNTYLGLWADMDLGCYNDDYMGCDVKRSAFYAYNGDNNDDSVCASPGYGNLLPAQGIVILKGPEADAGDGLDNNRDCTVDEPGETIDLSHFLNFQSDFSDTGLPQADTAYYNYLRGIWIDGTPLTYGGSGHKSGGDACAFVFPGQSDHPIEWGTGGNCQAPGYPQYDWSEDQLGNPPGDRKGVGGAGPFTFSPGEEICFDAAFVFAQSAGGNPMQSLYKLQNSIDSVQAYFDAGLNHCICVPGPLGLRDSRVPEVAALFPNPSGDYLFIRTGMPGQAVYTIFSSTGQAVMHGTLVRQNEQLNISALAPGFYLMQLSGNTHTFTSKFIRN